MYTAAVLTSQARQSLLEAVKLPSDWKTICHHMTINMGDSSKGPAKGLLGKSVKMTVVAVAKNDKVIAAKVETQVPSVNTVKHVTLAVDVKNGGKPVMSNQLTEWVSVEPFDIDGTIEECQ